MSISKLFLIAGAFSIIVLLALEPALAQGPLPQSSPPGVSASFVPGEILVKFQSHVSLSGAQGSLRSEGLQPLQASRRGGLLRVQVAPGREAETIAALMARGDVEFATPNYIIQALGDPNDPFYSLQWALKQSQDHDIDAPEAWNLYTGGSNITIAIVDSGVDLDHPDLQAKIVPGYDFVNDDNEPDDDLGHGTHVAGIAAADTNNGLGVAGVSWGAAIMPLKILNSAGNGTTFDLADAVYYAVDNGARVINMSLGGSGSKWPCDWPEVEAAFDYAADHGVLLVAASGNEGQNGVNCPAAYEQAIAVGSTTAADARSSFSNYGPRLDIAAPGSNIYSTFPGSYGYNSGTSMATPHVAGLAALVWSLAPSLTDSQVRDILQNSADDLGAVGWDQYFGYGRINARPALEPLTPLTPLQLSLVIDDDSDPLDRTIQITTANPDVITWTATISPSVSWLGLFAPTSGTISVLSAPSGISLLATQPATHNRYTTTLVVAGTAVSGEAVGPRTTEVVLYYFPQFYPYHFPIVSKN